MALAVVEPDREDLIELSNRPRQADRRVHSSTQQDHRSFHRFSRSLTIRSQDEYHRRDHRVNARLTLEETWRT